MAELEIRVDRKLMEVGAVLYHDDMVVRDIAIQENTTVKAVKSWGKQVRVKLRDEEFRKRVGLDV
ncbi:hypothetical protein GCM10011409_23820 [Lentibacillus populi]|uniref:Uncharacterized protein n=1 Tax=Lentibacillus populi TaxID=1827502 RepID=A0A9W5X649_9BACI|nr:MULTISPECIES: hypothetical protein [Bacillaceae]GGB45487.1 hypothetical protein GCM10011409_23820 [Lentibacillus populi]